MASIAPASTQRANLGLRYLVYWLRKSRDHPFQHLRSESAWMPNYLLSLHDSKRFQYINFPLFRGIISALAHTHRADNEWNWYPIQEVLDYLRNFTKQEQDLMRTLWSNYYDQPDSDPE